METALIVAVCWLYTVTCWYSLRRQDMKRGAVRRHPSKYGDDQALF
jgi:hypothetical protein